MVDDEGSVFSQENPPLGVKKQVPSVRDIAVQVDQPKHAPVKVPPGQPSGTSRLADKQTPFASLFTCLLCNQTTNQA